MKFYQFLYRRRYECPDPDAAFFKYRSDYIFKGIPETSDYAHRISVYVILLEASVDECLEVVVYQLLDVWMAVM